MNGKLAGLGIVALALASGAAHSEVSSTVTIASEYDFRGITQSALDPAFQASLDWSGESGLYAGLWGSNIDFGNYIPDDPYIPPGGLDPDADPEEESVDLNVEVDAILGYAGSFTEELGYDVGTTYYKYFGGGNNGDNDFDYFEVYAGLSYTVFSATLSPKLWYAWDYSNSGDSAWYGEINADYPLPAELGLTLHYGYSGGDYWSSLDSEYYDFAVGLTRSFGRFDFAVKYIDGSDLKDSDCSRSSVSCGGDPVFSSQAVVFASISTTFPWTKAE